MFCRILRLINANMVTAKIILYQLQLFFSELPLRKGLIKLPACQHVAL